jgi:hypothetical protein
MAELSEFSGGQNTQIAMLSMIVVVLSLCFNIGSVIVH